MQRLKILYFGSPPYCIPFINQLVKEDIEIVGMVESIKNLGSINRKVNVKNNLFKEAIFKLYSLIKYKKTVNKLELILLKNNINLYQTSDVNSEEFIEIVKRLSPDLIIVTGFNQIFKRELIKLPKIAVINFHPSLLPAYRGAMPNFWVIRNGEGKTGVSAHFINEKIDDGDIIGQKEVIIEKSDTGISLEEKVAQAGAKLLSEIIKKFQQGEQIIPIPQDVSKKSYFPKINEKICQLKWDMSVKEIYNLIRASQHWLNAYFVYREKKIEVLESKIIPKIYFQEDNDIGLIMNIKKKRLFVKCKDGILGLNNFRIKGKKISTQNLVKKLGIKKGDRL